MVDAQNPAASRAWHTLLYSPDSTLSIGFLPLEDDLGRLDERPIEDRLRSKLPITKGSVFELSVMTATRGYQPQPRMLTAAETERMLAGEPIELERVRYSLADKHKLNMA